MKEAFLGLDGELPGGEGPHPLLLADGLQALLVGGHALADGAGQLLAKVDGGVLLALEETKEKSVRYWELGIGHILGSGSKIVTFR